MPLTCTGAERDYVIQISGEVDHHGAKALLAALDEELSRRLPHTLTLDLSGVTFMDSSGIALLMRCKQQMAALEGTMRVIHTPPQALRMLTAAKINQHITIE